jgi:hypothetical protein
LIDVKPAEQSDSALCANGKFNSPESFGTLPLTFITKDSMEQMEAKLSQTACVPGSPFNLISVGDKVKVGLDRSLSK